ncbi:MAG: tRNA (N(6)-L-threonylcarbamoyladenosine(37)-C(2))-methylthiotransferase MtaB [Oscillospiraceae bacterium]|nr:tRNA (N(6)-L-threonylcarbamoyladenosine(37)-C(2))-methylthiotransferase MtaB [Oscillospiraceae bacterium]
MRYIIATLGCKVNQYESEAIDQLLRAHGHENVESGAGADAIVVNTCAVTAEGVRKVRQLCRRLERENPGAALCLCGCWTQVESAAAAELGAEVLFGTGDRQGFVAAVERTAALRAGDGEPSAPIRSVDDPFRRKHFDELPAGAYAGHARAYLKIQDGCDNFCSYCVIPYARGRVLSLSAEKCAAAAAALDTRGYREIVVTGIEIASWGKDLPGRPGLIDALEAMGAAVGPETRLHLGSLEPTAVTDAFVERLRRLPVNPHFHLSLQSGCDATLKRMRRKYTRSEYFAALERLREAFPGCSLTTDLIVGFPGEDEAEFRETLDFLRRCAFAAVHVFPYSRRPGTRAADFPDQVSREEKARRVAAASALAAETGRAYRAGLVGATLSVLFETERDGICLGHAENYAEVAVPGTKFRGLVKKVKITGIQGEKLVGVAL